MMASSYGGVGLCDVVLAGAMAVWFGLPITDVGEKEFDAKM